MKKFLNGFCCAFRGLWETLLSERNMRIHLSIALLVIFFGAVCRISSAEWLAILAFCGTVFCAEAHNTAIELTLDKLGSEKNEMTRRAKDAAAGGVLATATASAIGGGIIFFRKSRIEAAIGFLASRCWILPVFIAACAALLVFIIRPKKERKSK